MPSLGRKGGILKKCPRVLKLTSEGVGEMFEGDFADTSPISTYVDGGRAEGLAFADPGARTPIGVSGNSFITTIYTNIIYISGELTKTLA